MFYFVIIQMIQAIVISRYSDPHGSKIISHIEEHEKGDYNDNRVERKINILLTVSRSRLNVTLTSTP